MTKILPAEYKARQKRCATTMSSLGIDYLFLLPGSNFNYLTGLKFARERYRILAAIFSREGKLTLMGLEFEESKMRFCPTEAEIITFADHVDQYAIVADLIKRDSDSKPKIAVELTTNYYHILALKKSLPEAELVDPVPVTDDLRAIKSPAEIECFKEACRKTGARMAKVPSQLKEGMTELDLVKLFGRSAMIQFGLTTSMPNETAGNRALLKNDIIVIDAGDRVEGYRSDMTRAFFFGKPTTRMIEVFRVVHEAESAAIDAAEPGAPSEIIDLAARKVIENAGYGKYFNHRGGHGLGLDFHEFPICVAGNKRPLQPGMVLTAEPGIYLPGEFGIRLEDDLLITETGCEVLSDR